MASRTLASIGAAALAAALCVSPLAGQGRGRGPAAPAADGVPVQVLCLATLALLVVSLWPGPTARPARTRPLVRPGVGAPTG